MSIAKKEGQHLYNELLHQSRENIEFRKAAENFASIQLNIAKSYGIIIRKWDESLHPRDENGRFTESGVSPTGENSLKVKGFKNKQKLNNHWINGRTHQDEYKADGITTAKQYEQRAVELLESATSETILGHLDKDDNIIRYDVEKNDFVKGNIQNGVFTMFKPVTGQAYYDNQRKRDLEYGGKA